MVLIFLQLGLLSGFSLQTSPEAECEEIGEAKQEVTEKEQQFWTGNGASRGKSKTKQRGPANGNIAMKCVLTK